MKEIKLTKLQKEEAKKLGEGKVIVAYLDGKAIRMETENGEDPFVWRNNKWRRMNWYG
jgi:hypothetical protein